MPTLQSVPSELPNPPYPADTKANGYRPEFDIRRIKQSSTWKLADGQVRNILLRLWLESWEEIPAGSFENDDELIAASIDINIELFQGYRKQIMRGWKLHNDGRLYHPYITDQVHKMLKTRRKSAEKVKEWRAKKALENAKCNQLPTRDQKVGNRQEQEQEQEQEYTITTHQGNLESPSSFLSRGSEKSIGKAQKTSQPQTKRTSSERATSSSSWEDVLTVIERVNLRSGRNHQLKNRHGKYTSDAGLIRSRINEWGLDDALRVVENRADVWLGDDTMEPYFRIGTIFARKNFEQYRSAATKPAYTYGSFLHEGKTVIEGDARQI